MHGIVDSALVTRIRFVVHDVEVATEQWSAFLGVEPVVPPTWVGCGPAMHLTYRGRAQPEADMRVSQFQVGSDNFIELMQPNEHPSVWREALDTEGEGLHSITFYVGDLPLVVDRSLALGAELLQSADFSTGDGRYAYLDFREQLKTIIEIEQRDMDRPAQ